MLVQFTEAESNNKIYVNTKNVVAAFSGTEGQFDGKTIINLLNGNLIVSEDLDSVIRNINEVLKNG